jgi:hypothetical protein
MIPTVEWMSRYFNKFNKQYFEGKLNEPQFVIGCPDGTWGYLEYNAEYNRLTRTITRVKTTPKLMLTNKYDRRAKDIANTMLHEMIHLYIYSVLKKYPLMQHNNPAFLKFQKILNNNGWEISEENQPKPTDKLISPNKRNKSMSNNKSNNQQNKVDINNLITTLDNMINQNQFRYKSTVISANSFKNKLNRELQLNENYIFNLINETLNKTIINQEISKKDLPGIIKESVNIILKEINIK